MRRAHTVYGVVCLLIIGLLAAGIYLALAPNESTGSVILQQLTPRPRPTPAPPTAALVSETGENPIVVESVTPSPLPSATGTATFTRTATGTATGTPTPTPTRTLSPGSRVITVAAGDTLTALAQRYGSSVEAIVAANPGISRTTSLSVGQQLIIPPR
jgi:LysM repeat protein